MFVGLVILTLALLIAVMGTAPESYELIHFLAEMG